MEVDFDHYLWELGRERARGAAARAPRPGRVHSHEQGRGAGHRRGRAASAGRSRCDSAGWATPCTSPTSIRRSRRRSPPRSAAAPSPRRTTSATRRLRARWPRAPCSRPARSSCGSTTRGCSSPGRCGSSRRSTRQLMFDVNVLGTMHGMAAALDAMIPAGRGHIVNIVSLAGLSAVPGEAVYAGTKHAVMGLSLSTMLDLRIAGLEGRDDQLHLPRRHVDADALRQAGRPRRLDVVLGRAAAARATSPTSSRRWCGTRGRSRRCRPGAAGWRGPSTSRRGSRWLGGPVVARAAARKQGKMRQKLVDDPARGGLIGEAGATRQSGEKSERRPGRPR